MRLAISNIAWDITEDELISDLLQRYKIDAIDIAPGKYFPEPSKATEQEILRVKSWWSDRNIEITGMQALLFGTIGLNVFSNQETQQIMLDHLAAICRIGGIIGAPRIVFGSPKNRDRSGLSDTESKIIALDFFRRLGDIALSHQVLICLEPNPPCYGANFMTNSEETTAIVKEINHPAVRMQLDTGALAINNEDYGTILNNYSALIGHIHASEPDLLPLGDGGCNHQQAAKAILEHLPQHIVCIEMLATKDEAHLVSIDRALNIATQIYRSDSTGDTE